MKIIKLDFPENQYVKQESNKNQIVLHHTVSGGKAAAVAHYWEGVEHRIATSYIIERDGTINELFDPKYWGGHLGMKVKHFMLFNLGYKNLNRTSIGIELISWGGIKKINNKFYACYGNEVKDNILELPKYRGYTYFHKYTNEQIESLKNLLIDLGNRFKIPLDFHENIFETNSSAISGKSGIWSHTSYRPDKSDIFPQKEMIEMLKNLTKIK